MALNKQVSIYSFDTSAFYTNYEKDLAYLTSGLNKESARLKQKVNKIRRLMKKKGCDVDLFIKRASLLMYLEDRLEKVDTRISNLKKIAKELLVEELNSKDDDFVRTLRSESLRPQNVISVFESALTRMLDMSDEDTIYDDLMVIRTYYFQILKNLVVGGFLHNGEKYILLTASAGQIRTKKAVFIKESLYKQHEKSIMCGLSMEKVNSCGGMNINKWMAYIALVSSATDKWEEFDIDKSIVVDDFETQYNDWVDNIDYETYEITREKIDVTIPHTDGVGIMLDGKTTMVRLPFVKGLMVATPFDTFIREHKRKGKKWFKDNGYDYDRFGKVKDIYGKEYDILEDDIRYIFTKSQFKMSKYYDSWDQYKEYFKKFNCEACKCNEEEDIPVNKNKNTKNDVPYLYSESRINYQMLQTLTDISDDEILELCRKSQSEIIDIARDRKHMLDAFGVEEGVVNNGNSLQKSLAIYPELLQDVHCKETLKQTKASLVKQAKSGRIRIDGTYTFVSPDTYAFMEWLFLGIENPKGILETNEVSCRLFPSDIKLDCLRSPSLSLEHAIRRNITNPDTRKWFNTNCIYTSTRDMISKILQFDVDGDKLLVVRDKLLIEIAERNIKKYDVVPLYYDMKKAKEEMLNNKTLYDGMTKAYTGGNIGVISNDISKMWNSFTDDFETNKDILKVIKLMCMENNFTIDFAKTLFKPTRPKHIEGLIKKYTRLKVPHFFKYAKDKDKSQVEDINNSTVNRFDVLINNPNFIWSASNLGKFDYHMLMSDPNVEVNEDIINRYVELNRVKSRLFNEERDRKKKEWYISKHIRKHLSKGYDINYVVDVIIKYLHESNAINKNTLWDSFGDIIYSNLNKNIPKNTKLCDVCGDRFEITNNRAMYCKKCYEDINRKSALERYFNSKKS